MLCGKSESRSFKNRHCFQSSTATNCKPVFYFAGLKCSVATLKDAALTKEQIALWREKLEHAKERDLSRKNFSRDVKEELDGLEKDLTGFDPDFLAEILRQLAAAMIPDGNNALRLRFSRSILKIVKPDDPIKMLLLIQIIASHLATMNVAELMHFSKGPEHVNCYGNIFSKLARTSAQIEALYRLGSGAEQRFNVSVAEGGRAIVGNINHNSGSSGTIESAKPPLALSDQSGTAMPVILPNDQSAATVPGIEQNELPAPSAKRRRRRA